MLQNWTNHNPLDFHSIHWEALKESEEAHVEPDEGERDDYPPETWSAVTPRGAAAPAGQMNPSASAPPTKKRKEKNWHSIQFMKKT